MNSRFIGKPVTVTARGDKNTPVSFILENREYVIVEITESWPDYGFGNRIAGKRKWWQRHNRFYYRVRTESGDTYEIYSDRHVSKRSAQDRKWFASRKY